MADPARCVTHCLDACECQRERIKRLEAVAADAANLLMDMGVVHEAEPPGVSYTTVQLHPQDIIDLRAALDHLAALKPDGMP